MPQHTDTSTSPWQLRHAPSIGKYWYNIKTGETRHDAPRFDEPIAATATVHTASPSDDQSRPWSPPQLQHSLFNDSVHTRRGHWHTPSSWDDTTTPPRHGPLSSLSADTPYSLASFGSPITPDQRGSKQALWQVLLGDVHGSASSSQQQSQQEPLSTPTRAIAPRLASPAQPSSQSTEAMCNSSASEADVGYKLHGHQAKAIAFPLHDDVGATGIAWTSDDEPAGSDPSAPTDSRKRKGFTKPARCGTAAAFAEAGLLRDPARRKRRAKPRAANTLRMQLLICWGLFSAWVLDTLAYLQASNYLELARQVWARLTTHASDQPSRRPTPDLTELTRDAELGRDTPVCSQPATPARPPDAVARTLDYSLPDHRASAAAPTTASPAIPSPARSPLDMATLYAQACS